MSFPPLIPFSFHFPLVFRFLFCPSYASSSSSHITFSSFSAHSPSSTSSQYSYFSVPYSSPSVPSSSTLMSLFRTSSAPLTLPLRLLISHSHPFPHTLSLQLPFQTLLLPFRLPPLLCPPSAPFSPLFNFIFLFVSLFYFILSTSFSLLHSHYFILSTSFSLLHSLFFFITLIQHFFCFHFRQNLTYTQSLHFFFFFPITIPTRAFSKHKKGLLQKHKRPFINTKTN